LLPQEPQIDQPLGVAIEDVLPCVAALSNVVRSINGHNTRETSHVYKCES
jgi:hypothetical protein